MDFEPIPVPNGYSPLADFTQIPLESEVKVIGVVVDYLPPAQTRGSDYCCTIAFQDSSLLGSHHSQTGIRTRIFQPEYHMPKRVELGDIVMIRSTQWREINGNRMLLDSKKRAEYLFFPGTSIPDAAFKAPHVSDENRAIEHKPLPGKVVSPPTIEEQDYIIKLREWAKKHQDYLPQPYPGAVAAQPPVPSRPIVAPHGPANSVSARPPSPVNGLLRDMSYKFAFLKDVRDGKFHELIGEVVKMYDSGNVIDLYISDYTYNSLLFDYKENNDGDGDGRDGDPYGYTESLKPKRKWQGPWGKHTICIGLFDPHASYVRRIVNEGDFVRIRNARCLVRDGCLQAKLHEDRLHPGQVDIAKVPVGGEIHQAIAQLKEDYWQARGNKGKNSVSKSEKRKRKKQQKKEQEVKDARHKATTDAGGAADAEEENSLFVGEARDKLNPKVVAANPEKQFLSLTKIIETPYRTYQDRHGEEQTLPCINMKCRSRVRVVDFFPPDLEDFAQSIDDPKYNNTDADCESSGVSMEDSSLRPSRWEWAFYLLVEDARPPAGQAPLQLPLLVHGQDAEYLLKLDAMDLRHNLQVQDQLRRKLWTLWGNIEELKSEGKLNDEIKPTNYPFECCIAEYGVLDGDDETGEWKRQHRIFQTTIRD